MTTLTDDDIEQLQALRDDNKRATNDQVVTPNGAVSAAECHGWQQRRQDDERPVDIADDTEWSLHAVKYHACERCDHDHDDEP